DGVDSTPVVFSIREQDDNAALHIPICHQANRSCEGGSNGGSIFNHTRVDAIEAIKDKFMVERERAEQVWLCCKDQQCEAIISTVSDKLLHGRFHGVDAPNLPSLEPKIQCIHGRGKVECENDVDARRTDLRLGASQLGPCQCNDQQRERKEAKSA